MVLLSKRFLTTHMQLDHGQYRYQCKICGKGFASTTTLRGHMSWHTGIKEYQCQTCSKEFRYPQDLQKHLRSRHTQPSGSQ